VNRYCREGAAGLTSRHRARPSNRQLAPGLANLALTIIRERYAAFGPTLACEKLREHHGVRVGTETVRRLMRPVPPFDSTANQSAFTATRRRFSGAITNMPPPVMVIPACTT
jgi:hypothetical protein